MNIERLNKLADFLDDLPPDLSNIEFDMDQWIVREFNIDAVKKTLYGGDVPCRACAIGMALLAGIFESEGLKKELDRRGFYPQYRLSSGIHAVLDFFEIDLETFYELFSATGYWGRPSPNHVAKNIRAII